MFEDYLKSLSGEDWKFVEEAGLSTSLKEDVADFFGYGNVPPRVFSQQQARTETEPTTAPISTFKLCR